MRLGDLTAAHRGRTMRLEGLPPRAIVSVRHYGLRLDRKAPEVPMTSVIYLNPQPDQPEMCGAVNKPSDTPVEVTGA
jgi:hypothetical protein